MTQTIPTYVELPKDLRDRIEDERKESGWTLREAMIRLLSKGLEKTS